MTWIYYVTPEVDAQSSYPLLIGVAVGTTCLMLTTVCLRMLVRGRILKALGVDDYIILSTAVRHCLEVVKDRADVTKFLTVVYISIIIAQTRYGLGLAVALRPEQALDTYTKINFAGRPFYNVNITGFKVAMCFTYLRLMEHTAMTRYRRAIWAVMIFTIVTHIAIIFTLIFYCDPVQSAWNVAVDGTCLPTNPLYYSTSGLTILCDLLVFSLPLPMFLGLRVDRQRKAALIVTVLFGLVTTICSSMRLAQVPQVNRNGDATRLLLWAMAEVNTGIITTSLPALGPLIRKLWSSSGLHPSAGSYGGSAPHRSDQLKMQKFSHRGRASDVFAVGKNGAIDHWPEEHESQDNILIHGSGRHWDASNDHPDQITRTVHVEISRTDRDFG